MALVKKERTCECGHVGGHYLEDGIRAEFFGKDAIPIGIGNTSFKMANRNRTYDGLGQPFDAWIVPTANNRLKYKHR